MSRTRPSIAAACMVVVAGGLSLALGCGSTPDTATPESPQDEGNRAATSNPDHPGLQRIPPTTTPDLIARSPETARSEAKTSGLRVRFAPSHYACSSPPSGSVVWQNPRPGTKTHYAGMQAGTSVQATCGQRNAAGQPCLASQLALSTNGAGSGYTGTGGQVSLQVEIENRGHSACGLDSTLQLAVERSGSLAGSIRGNPATVQVHWGLRSRDTLTTEWLWPSWCGPRGGVDLVATFAGMTASGGSPSPICIDERAEPYLQGVNVSTKPLP